MRTYVCVLEDGSDVFAGCVVVLGRDLPHATRAAGWLAPDCSPVALVSREDLERRPARWIVFYRTITVGSKTGGWQGVDDASAEEAARRYTYCDATVRIAPVYVARRDDLLRLLDGPVNVWRRVEEMARV